MGSEPVGLSLAEIERRIKNHALWKAGKVSRYAALKMQRCTREQIIRELDIDPSQYPHIRRWYKEAIAAEDKYGTPSQKEMAHGLRVISPPPEGGTERRRVAA